MAVFSILRSQVDRSQDAYRKKCEKNQANAQKRYVKKPQQEDSNAAMACDGMRLHANACLPNPNPNPSPNPDIDGVVNTPSIYSSAQAQESESDMDKQFDLVWRLYGKPTGNIHRLRQRWRELPPDDRRRIREYVPLYVRARPDRRFRKDFDNFLSNRTWETEPITSEDIENRDNTENMAYGNKYQFSNQRNEGRRDAAYRQAGELVSRLIPGGQGGACATGRAQGTVPLG